MVNKTCPQCFGTIRPTDPYCPKCGPKPKRQHKSYQERAGEANRRSLYSSEYKRNRQIAIERTQGRCAICRAQVATKSGNVWKCAPGAAVHHIVKRTHNGADSADNLVLVCRKCHYTLDH